MFSHVFPAVGIQNVKVQKEFWKRFDPLPPSWFSRAGVVPNSDPCQITTNYNQNPLVLVGLGLGVGEGLGLGVGLGLGNQVAISTRGGNNLAGVENGHNTGFKRI